MSDLISRRRAISILEQLDEHSLTGKMDISNAIYLLENQPREYDADNVVQELEELREKDVCDYLDCDVCLYNEKCGVETDQSDNLKWDKAIEIVKRGGVSDDCCEWKYTREIMDNAEFKVGCNPNALKRGIVPNNFSYCNFKYCPYCGKKIKVVE